MKKKLLSVLCILLLCAALAVSAAGENIPSSDVSAAFYGEFSAFLDGVAEGDTVSTVFTLDIESLKRAGLKTKWTPSDGLSEFNLDGVAAAFWEQLDFARVLELLERNRPFELCWYDKTESGGASCKCGFSYDSGVSPTEIEVVSASVVLRVSADYRGEGYDPNAPTVRPDRIREVLTAQATADAIAEAHADKEPFEMLCAFRDEILPLVSYHSLAASGAYPYGDPWQPFYVFDGDPETNVVCEGYAKALQYLSDAAGLQVTTVTGRMNDENHMWNVVTMQDGKNYLLDLTNTDDGTVGEGGELFLAGAVGSPTEGYAVNVGGEEILYRYDADTLALYSDATLTLSSDAYSEFFGVGFESTAGTMEFSYDGTPLKAFSRTETVTGDPAWLDYTKGAVIYFGDPSVDETADLTPAWYSLNADGTRGERLDAVPINAGSYVLVVTRLSDRREFTSPTVRITPVPVRIESVTAESRVYDGTTAITLSDVRLVADTPLPAHLCADLTALCAALPRASVGSYSYVILTGEFRFATEEINYVPIGAPIADLTAPLTVSKAPAPILSPVSLPLSAPHFVFDVAEHLTAHLPEDAGDLFISVESADKWGRLTVTEWKMDEHARITAEFTGLHGGDRLEFCLTVTAQNYEDVTFTLSATAPCPYSSHRFEDYRADGNATCRADGTKTATCEGCTVTDTLPDAGSRLSHSFAQGVCTACGAPAPLPPAETETEEASSEPTESTGLPATEAEAADSTEAETSPAEDSSSHADLPWEWIAAIAASVVLLFTLAILILRGKH